MFLCTIRSTYLVERFLVQFLPQQVFQLGDPHSGNGGDKDIGNAFRQIFGQCLNQLFIQHIALGDSQDTAFILQIRIILDQFA